MMYEHDGDRRRKRRRGRDQRNKWKQIGISNTFKYEIIKSIIITDR